MQILAACAHGGSLGLRCFPDTGPQTQVHPANEFAVGIHEFVLTVHVHSPDCLIT